MQEEGPRASKAGKVTHAPVMTDDVGTHPSKVSPVDSLPRMGRVDSGIEDTADAESEESVVQSGQINTGAGTTDENSGDATRDAGGTTDGTDKDAARGPRGNGGDQTSIWEDDDDEDDDEEEEEDAMGEEGTDLGDDPEVAAAAKRDEALEVDFVPDEGADAEDYCLT